MNHQIKSIQDQIYEYGISHSIEDLKELNDTNYSFNELYAHQAHLLALLMMRLPYSWKVKPAFSRTIFIVGFPSPDGMISYKCSNEYWNLFKIPILPSLPLAYGASETNILHKLESYINSSESQLLNSKNISKIEEIVKNQILPVFDDELEKAAFIGFYNL